MAFFCLCQHSFFLVIEKLRFYQLKYQFLPQKATYILLYYRSFLYLCKKVYPNIEQRI